MNRIAQLTLIAILLLVPLAKAEDARWYKGNLHTHTLWSDGDDFPEMVALWYADNGYNFLGLSDHNILSQGEKWMPVRKVVERGGKMPMDKYKARFPDVMKVRKGEQGEEVQLQPLDVIKKLTEKPGEFLMIQSEEITGNYEVPSGDPAKPKRLPVHMNATNIQELVKPATGPSPREIMAGNLKAIEEQSKRTGKPIVVHLNHPNFGWGVSAADLAAVLEERYFEIYNGHPGVRQTGDAEHMSMEKMWDVCNTIRIAQMNSKPLIGLATDDSHHYHVPGMARSTSGRGWVMVRSKELTPDAITIAIRDGDFYASSGVTLSDVSYDKATKTIRLSIKPDGDATFTTQFIGTPKNFADGGKTPLDSEKVGTIFKTQQGSTAEYTLTGDELYVRALVTSSKNPVNPSYEGQKQQAWTQPVQRSSDPASMCAEPITTNASPPMVALAEWLCPGAGYWMLGQKTRALVVGVSIFALFTLGILISGIRVVQAPDMSGGGGVMQRMLNRPWFIGQVFMGPTAVGSAWISDQLATSARFHKIEAKARLAEIGTLYTAVAGMLNLLAIIDSSHRAATSKAAK